MIDYRIYYKACDADRLFHNSLVEDVGEYRAGDARYDTTQTGWSTKTKYLCARARRAKERWHNHCEKHREESRRVAGPENNNKGIQQWNTRQGIAQVVKPKLKCSVMTSLNPKYIAIHATAGSDCLMDCFRPYRARQSNRPITISLKSHTLSMGGHSIFVIAQEHRADLNSRLSSRPCMRD